MIINKISIITINYNNFVGLENTILSVLNLNYPNIEFIIIDGGSTDQSVEIIKKYKDKISYWVSEKDNGVFDAMNKGIKIASGNWAIFMNSGDTFVNNEVLSQICWEENRNIALLYGNRIVDGKIMTYPFPIKSLEFGMIMACHQSMFFNKSILKETLYYNIRHKLYCEYDLVSRIYKKGLKLKYLDITIANYISGGISSTKSFDASYAKYYFLLKNFGVLGILKGGLEKIKILKLPKPKRTSYTINE